MFSKTFVRLNSSGVTSKWQRFVPSSGSFPKGYELNSISCGIKKNNSLDLALLTSNPPANTAAVYTTNQFQAAPIQICKENLSKSQSKISSVIINSGCANAVTGTQGLKNAKLITNLVESTLKTKENSTLIMSTGVIGQQLPMEKISKGIEIIPNDLGSSFDHWFKAAKGIMTTDTFPKLVSNHFSINNKTYSIAGISKGAGMISPNMATLLGFIVTDAPISAKALKSILQYSVNRSYNCVSVDGDMSTNDTIIAMANGNEEPIIEEGSKEYDLVLKEFLEISQNLAQLLARDGEGATKFVTLNVKNCPSFKIAHEIASSIANSPLVKTALFGNDANWGRILAAVGYANINLKLDVKKINLSFIDTETKEILKLLVNGEPQSVDEVKALEILKKEDLIVDLDIGNGTENCQYWTCDLSHDYVTINGDYRS